MAKQFSLGQIYEKIARINEIEEKDPQLALNNINAILNIHSIECRSLINEGKVEKDKANLYADIPKEEDIQSWLANIVHGKLSEGQTYHQFYLNAKSSLSPSQSMVEAGILKYMHKYCEQVKMKVESRILKDNAK